MNQLSIEFEPRHHARTSDPLTSHMAAERVREFAGGHSALILECLKRNGPQTADEIAKRTELTSVQICRRLPDLQKNGNAEPMEIMRLSASGRQERVWRAV